MLFFRVSSSSLPLLYLTGAENTTLSITRIKLQFSFKWFELGSNLLSIDRRKQTAIGCFAYLFYYGRLGDIKGRPSSLSGYDHSFIHSLNLRDLALRSITTSIIHTTLHDARVHGQHTPKAPRFRLQPIQPQPNLHEIQQPKLLVVPRGRHPPIIVSNTEQASHQSGERKGPPLKKKVKRKRRRNPFFFLSQPT